MDIHGESEGILVADGLVNAHSSMNIFWWWGLKRILTNAEADYGIYAARREIA